MAHNTASLHDLCSWTAQEIDLLITNGETPDHWQVQPIPTIALMELVRQAIDKSNALSLRQGFPAVLTSLGLKQPKHLVGLISKVKRHVNKAEQTGNYLPLCCELPELAKSTKEIIGPACNEIGITPAWLGTDEITEEVISNKVILELHQFRSKKGITWKIVVEKWWPKLFPGTEDQPPKLGTVSSSWTALAKNKEHISRTSKSDKTKTFLQNRYILPTTRPTNPEHLHVQVDDDMDMRQNTSSDTIDSGYETSSSDNSSDVESMNYLLRSHGDTVAVLHELLQLERQEKLHLQEELATERQERLSMEEQATASKEDAKNLMAEKRYIQEQWKRSETSFKYELRKSRELSAELQEEVSKWKSCNVSRRLITKTSQLKDEKKKSCKLKAEVEKLKEHVQKLNENLKEKRRISKNKTEQARYHRLKRSEEQKGYEGENAKLKAQLADLEREHDELRCELDEVMGDREITTFEDGRFTSDIRVVCYELISRGVGSKHVSDIIRLVLKRVAGYDCGRLPKPTLIRLMAFEQAILSKECAKLAIENSDVPVTLQMDGTSKKHIPYIAMLASTDSGTVGMGLTEVQTEDSETLLSELISATNQLLTISDGTCEPQQKRVNELLLKMKNTMTDRCIINKKFIELLEQWRSEALPKVIEHWDSLSEAVKDNMTIVNDLYCGKHLILNFQEYAGVALNEWEKVEVNGGKLGREKFLNWSRKESATFLAIRSVCEAFGPDSNPQAGSPVEFSDQMELIGDKCRLSAYRGNRFNVPFSNGAAVYYHHHHGHVQQVIKTLPLHKQKNQLTRSVVHDLQDGVIIGGIRAMGILNSHITQPLMRMLDKLDLHVMDTSKYYTRLHDCMSMWMKDPQELLNDTAELFADFIPQKDEVHRTLYAEVDEDVEFYTKQALIMILHNMYVCATRQLEDHLPGGKYANPSTSLVNETSACPKDNVAAERVFAGLDHLKRKSPNITALAMEGILMWALNKTGAYLDECSSEKREKLISKAMKSRKHVVKLYHDKIDMIKANRQKNVEKRLKDKEDREKKLVSQTVINTDTVLKTCGFICKNVSDVDKLANESDESKLRNALLAQIRYYKSVNRGVVKGSLFFVSSGGKPLGTHDLIANLKEIINLLQFAESSSNEQGQSVELNSKFKEKSRNELKEKLLAKLNRGTKRKCPFPENIVGKRVRHMCLSPDGSELVTYKGKVIRESTSKDIDELMEDEYKSYFEKGFTFYTLIYDPPYNQLFCYPLKKEWDDELLSVM